MITLEIKVGQNDPADTRGKRRQLRRLHGAKVEEAIEVIYNTSDGKRISVIRQNGSRVTKELKPEVKK